MSPGTGAGDVGGLGDVGDDAGSGPDSGPGDDVLGKIGHELRSPLTSVLGYAQLLGADSLTAPQRRYAQAIERNGRRLLHLVEEVLTGALLAAGTLEVARRDVDLVRVARDHTAEAGPAARAAGVSLTVAADGPVTVRGDADLLGQVVDRLVGNALAFTPPGGTVTVRVAPTLPGDGGGPGGAVVEVADTGTGMTPGELDRLTAHLARARALADGRDGGLGPGLGLPVADAVVRAHDGTLRVRSAPGRGTTVTVTLPTGPAPPSSAAGRSTPR